MKKIFGDDAIHMLPLHSGFIIATKQKTYDDYLVVSYKMATLETDALNPVTRNVYQLAKFGNNFQLFEKILPDYLNCKTLQLPDSRLFAIYPDGQAAVYDDMAQTLWSGALKYKDSGPADVALQGECIWATFPESNALIRYNVQSLREELRIGGGENSAFAAPCSLWINGNSMLVCNRDSHKILEINLSTFEAFDYAEFEEPVHQYIRIDNTEIVQLDSGVYTL